MYPLYDLPSLLSSSFTSDIQFYDCYIIATYILLYHLCSIPPVSCSYFIIWSVFSAWYRLLSLFCSCMLVFTTQFSMHVNHSDLSIHVYLSMPVTWHLHHHSLGSSDSPGSRVQIPKFGACRVSRLLIREVQLKRGSSAHRPELHPSRPSCSALEFFCYDSEPPFVLFIIVNHLYSRICAILVM